MSARTLVCEGLCNAGRVQRYDEAIRRAGRMRVSGDGDDVKETSAADSSVLDMVKSFVYTRHIFWNAGHMACSVCKTVRRWA